MVQKRYKEKKFQKVKSQFLDLSKDLAEQKKQEEEAEIEVRRAEEALREAKEEKRQKNKTC